MCLSRYRFGGYYLGLLIFGQLFIASCAKKATPPSSVKADATVQGIVSIQDKPAAGAQVYAYQMNEFSEEEKESSSQIEEILRTQLQEGKTLPVEEWPEAETAPAITSWEEDYPEFRGPADYKSAPTDKNGRYSLVLSPGRYYLVARKRTDSKIQAGPLTPKDYSSLVSKPLKLEAKYIHQQDFQLEELGKQSIDFARRYAIKTKETQIQGIIQDEDAQPLAGFSMVANQRVKVSQKPDFFSEPSNAKGEFTLYLPGEGIYYLQLRRTPLGKPIPIHIFSDYVNPADNSMEILEGEIISGIQVIRIHQTKEKQQK